MNEAQRSLIEIVGRTLFEKETDAEPNEAVMAEAERQTVTGLVSGRAYNVFVQASRVIYGHAQLTKVLRGIPFVTIKGYASAVYYPEPIRRTMGDVDLLVAPEDIERADEALRGAGYCPAPEDDTGLHLCYKKDGIEYELHRAVNGVDEGSASAEALLRDTLDTARAVPTESGEIMIPDDRHNALICLLHILSHMRNGGIGLRHFCDWACLAARVRDPEQLAESAMRSAGIWRTARIFSLTAVRYLGMPYREWMGREDEALLDAVMEDIMTSGNFGRARENKQTDWFTVRDKSRTRIGSLIATLNHVTGEHWPAARRLPVLMPFGWVFFSARYAVRVWTGKRTGFDLKEAWSASGDRNSVLRRLRIFEPE